MMLRRTILHRNLESNKIKKKKTWNQSKLGVVKQEMARVNIYILGISELKWMGMGEFIQIPIISTTVGNNPLEEVE